MRRRRSFWIGVVVLLALTGVFGTLYGASNVARGDHQESLQSLYSSSEGIASTLKLSLQHEQDLAVSAGATSVINGELTESQFIQWTASVHAFTRYPELQGISELSMVPTSQLSAFAAKEVADPSGPLAANGSFVVSPAGNRPYYCLITVSQSRLESNVLPAGLDYCTTSLGPALLTARDSGQNAYLPYKSGKTEELAIGTAIYSGGLVPTTVAARRAAFTCWIGTEILPGTVLATALIGHPSTAIAFRFGQGNTKVIFKAGSAPVGAQTKTINFGNGWHVAVSGAVVGTGILVNGDALSLLLVGLALSFLLAALIFVLGTSRSRALELVHERTDELQYQAFHDPLTGLPNRSLILQRMGQMVAKAREDHTTMATFFLDLDDFKDINDTLGHRSGDELLAEVGARLSGALRQGDTVGRLGGDEFVMVTAGTSTATGVEAIAARLFAVLEAPIQIASSEVSLTVTASIGIAIGDRDVPEELLRDADIALYRAKALGKNRAEVFTLAMQESVDDHRNLEVDLHSALEANQFFLLYQPMVDLASGDIMGFEALLRWRHPTRGVVQPNDFIPALEASGMIIPVGRWVLETACRQGARWQRQGHNFKVSVNVATAQLQRDAIADDTYRAVSTSGFDPSMLVLELTETTLMDDVEGMVARLQLLKAIGVRIAIDDFGTGFSSLARLQRFPIDILKIDQSFISQTGGSDMPAAFVRSIVQMGKALGLEVVAEGIETADQREYLSAESVDTGQGFLFAKPLDVSTIDHMLEYPTIDPIGAIIPIGTTPSSLVRSAG
jgi:diguanylate cyclase (GGDEF)-like protein